MYTSPTDYHAFITLLAICLDNDILYKKEQVIAWADEIVMRDEEPDDFFVDLCLMQQNSAKMIASRLHYYLHTTTNKCSVKPVLGVLHSFHLSHPEALEQVIKALYSLLFITSLTDVPESDIRHVEGSYNLSKDSMIGTPDEVYLKTLEFLRGYKDEVLLTPF